MELELLSQKETEEQFYLESKSKEARKEKIDDIEYTDSREAKDAMATEGVKHLLILKQHVGSTRITSGKIVLTISIVPTLWQGTKQLVVDVVVEIQLDGEDMEA